MAKLLEPGLRVLDVGSRRGVIESNARNQASRRSVRFDALRVVEDIPCTSLRIFDDRRSGNTDAHGRCCIVTTPGTHELHLLHPVLGGHFHQTITANTCAKQEWKYQAEPELYVYTTPLEQGTSDKGLSALEVWVSVKPPAADQSPVPCAFEGTINIPDHAGKTVNVVLKKPAAALGNPCHLPI